MPAQPRAAIPVERQRVEPADAALRIEAVDQDEVEFAVGLRDEIVTVADFDRDAARVAGQLEELHGGVDDRRIDLDDRQRRARPVPIEEFRQRRGAKANQQHGLRPPRRGPQQQRHHHVARVLELERPGSGDAHGALDPRRAEMQVADARLLAHLDGRGRAPMREEVHRTEDVMERPQESTAAAK